MAKQNPEKFIYWMKNIGSFGYLAYDTIVQIDCQYMFVNNCVIV